ncbi:sn-glycerol-3-phosphate import ATP-binding protein UgpC [Desulfococcaceae bacterium HSG9]|nr:sn-glycerol-3-phosphate import ATP-binding protein UgpC [Desulfococcaceae bacterium HSG9]
MAEVILEKVVKAYGKTEVIHGISTAIADGEFIVIVGPSGCGKSTVLRMIAGLEKISGGIIRIDGREVNNLEPKDRDIAMVFQNYALYPHMTVFNNMAYGLKLRKFTKDEIKHRVDQAAQLLQLDGLLERKPRQLSGGQRQRVAMGRCIVREPKVFLFDEPLSNLDAKLRVQMRLELRKLHERLKVTSIYVTHDQVEAMTLGDRLIVINEGAAEQIGSPLELYEKPATKFVAGFIGSPSMNFIEARLSRDGQSANIQGDVRLALSDDGAPDFGDRKVIIGIRPEHFNISESNPQAIPLSVDHIEILGADTMVYGRFADTPDLITIRLPDIHHFKSEKVLPLSVAPDKIHIFNKDTGARI